jgi:hypothetical protein
MLGALGALGSFGGGFGEGVTNMFELQEKLRKRQEDEAAFKAATLGGVGGLGADYQYGAGGQGAPQTAPTGSPAAGGAGATPGVDPNVMTGAYPTIPTQFTPVGNVADASMAANQPNPSLLGATRQRQEAELQDPETARLFYTRLTAEAGDDPEKRQQTGATFLNRAAALGVPLKAVLTGPYYPGSSDRNMARAGMGQPMIPATFNPVSPADFARGGTGNASMDPITGRQVGYGRGGEQTAFTGGYRTGEGAGVEAGTEPWARKVAGFQPTGSMARGPGGAQQPPMDPSNPALAQLEEQKRDIGKISPQDLAQARDKGSGPLTIGQAARRIDQVMPNAPQSAKFGALQKLLKLVNEEDQRKWQRFMQQETLRQRGLSEEHRQHAEGRAEAREERLAKTQKMALFRQDKEAHALGGSLDQLEKRATVFDELSGTAVRMGKQAATIADKISKSGLPLWQKVVRAAGRITGDPEVDALTFQLNSFKAEAAKLTSGSPNSNVLPVTVLKEADNFLSADASPASIRRLAEQVKTDAKIRIDETNKNRDRLTKRIKEIEDAYMRGEMPPPRKREDADLDTLGGSTGVDTGAPAPAGAAPAGGGGSGEIPALPPNWSYKVK